MSIKVSVVVPVYKTEPYLRQCLDSLINQKLRDIEIICVDDGSPDGAGEILDEYASKDARIKVIHQENKGLGAAYNAGQKIAKGEYVGYLDSDDWIEANGFYDLYQAAKKTGVDVVKAGGCFIDTQTSSSLSIKFPVQKCNRIITNMLEVPEFVNKHVSQWTAIYKRSFLAENQIYCPEKKRLAPDISFVYQVWALAKTLYVIPNAYVHYRQTNPNADTKQGSRMSFYLIEGHKEATKVLCEIPTFTPAHWGIKTRVEWEHFLYEWYHRCKTNRLKYIRQVAEIFRHDLRIKWVRPMNFNEREWNLYQFIAYMPFLFWLNDTLRFWTKREITPFGKKRFYRLFGVFQIEQTMYYKRYYFLGIPYWFERVYDGEFNQLREMNMMLRNEIYQLKNQLEGRRK